MILWTLIGIFALFVLFAFLREPLHKRFGFKVCSICAAVSITWIILIALKTAGMEISNLLLGILMGESVTGIMYLFENKAKQEGKNSLLWLKVVIIILGTLLVYLVLTKGFSLGFIIILIISTILAIGIYRKLKGKKKSKIIPAKHSKFRKEIEKLEKRFEHCCD